MLTKLALRPHSRLGFDIFIFKEHHETHGLFEKESSSATNKQENKLTQIKSKYIEQHEVHSH
jgi:hypothetical protein